MRIDAHQHFWRYSPASHAWIDNSMPQIKRDFLPDDLQPLLAAAGFDGCIAVQAQQDVAETQWLLDLAAQHPFIKGVVGWVDLCAPDVATQLAPLAANARLVGIRHIAQDEPDDFLVRDDFRNGVAALAQFDLAYDILIYARQLPAAIDLVKRFPQQRFVLDHIAKPAIRDGDLMPWAKGIAEISRQHNVGCKLSGIVTEAGWQSWTRGDLMPYIDTISDWFPPDRLMIGSDWPVCLLAAPYADAIALITDRIASLPAPDQSAILGETATRIYNLTE